MDEQPINNNQGDNSLAQHLDSNFADLHPPLNQQQASQQASRCLFCYDAPCVIACPTAIDIPKFIRQIATDNQAGAARTILSENIMGGTCARACPTEILCEQKCVLVKGEDEPIDVSSLQRYAVDPVIIAEQDHPFKRAANTGKKIAIIGAGPAGLACAHALAVFGHDVQIFEAKAKPGGLNEYGLAAYKMVDDFAAKEVKFILGVGGISIEYNQVFGRDVFLDDLKEKFDAVFVGIGLDKANSLGITGENLNGVQDALQFIANLRQAKDKSTLNVGQQVIVIGGGNTAIDAAIQAKRLGAACVTLVYRRGSAQMGATAWEQDLAKTNGVVVRDWAKPLEIKGDSQVQSMSFEQTKLSNGKLLGTGKTFTLPADQVLIAIGQNLDNQILETMDMANGKITVGDDGQTNVSGVFAGGDCIASGEDLTVQAVQDGKIAAAGIHDYLGGANG
ncbi:MAG: NAD(P)-dependent oxidoreductase [Robiginitomaculum sp.]|nr:NAD(P)-dependent oxidoreductase [Robiginitomaculum sp.]